MKKFQFKTKAPNGAVSEGVIQAATLESAKTRISGSGSVLIYIRPQQTFFDMPEYKFLQPKVKRQDIILFTWQLEILLKAGLPLVDCLTALKDLLKNQTMVTVIEDIIVKIKAGSSFSQTLEEYPDKFSPLYTSLVKAGEASGSLDQILGDLSEFLDWEDKMIKKLKGVIRYPALVLSAAVMAMIVVFTFVIPKFSVLFKQNNAELPTLTKVVLGLSNFLTAYWMVIIVALVALAFGFRRAYKFPDVKYKVDKAILNLPGIGTFYTKIAVARFSKVFSILYQNGISAIDALNLCRNINSNAIYLQEIDALEVKLKKGIKVGDSTRTSPIFKGLPSQMMSIGERSGSLGNMLNKLGTLYTEMLDNVSAELFAIIEPIMILMLGAVVLVLALGIFLPLWDTMNMFQQ